jgi:hypothetical protein
MKSEEDAAKIELVMKRAAMKYNFLDDSQKPDITHFPSVLNSEDNGLIGVTTRKKNELENIVEPCYPGASQGSRDCVVVLLHTTDKYMR